MRRVVTSKESFRDAVFTLQSVPPCFLCPRKLKGYFPSAGLRSDRAEMAFSALYGGVQEHRDNGSFL